MEYFTCPICDDKMERVTDAVIRWCKCSCLGVDSTPEYARFLGAVPKEAANFEEWYLQCKDVVEELRIKWENKPQYNFKQQKEEDIPDSTA